MDIDDPETTLQIHTSEDAAVDNDEPFSAFFLRYYSGHMGEFGHEFLEFEISLNEDGRAGTVKYINNTNYRREGRIEKEFGVSWTVIDQIRKIIEDSEILRENDSKWPPKDKDGKQELVIQLSSRHCKMETKKFGSLTDVRRTDDPDGIRVFYYFVQDVKALIFSLISLHYKLKPY